MATVAKNTQTAKNVRQKLIEARALFLAEHVKKSGKNMHLEFMYFELADIVPSAIRIFEKVGLVTVTNFAENAASMTVYDIDNMEDEGITFTCPYKEIAPIMSNKGKEVTNELQALGSSITYLRRYLYMMCLDIVEQDEIEAHLGENVSTTDSPKKAPATPEERKEIKKELTSENASAEDIESLKNYCKALLKVDPEQGEFVQTIAMKTDGFSRIPHSACLDLIEKIKDMLAQYKEVKK